MSGDQSATRAPHEPSSPSGAPAHRSPADTRQPPAPHDGGAALSESLHTLHLRPEEPEGGPGASAPSPGAQHAPYAAAGFASMMPVQATPGAIPVSPPMVPGWGASMPYMMPLPGGIPVGFVQPFNTPHPQGLPDYGGLPPRMPVPPMVPIGRTVYVGNLPAEATVDELLSLVKFGPIESVRLLPEKNCAFISFLNAQVAAAFHADSSVRHISLHGQELKIGWGKPSVPPPAVVMAVQQHQASRNVYIGQLDEDTTEQSLREDLSRFGPIDQVKIVRDQAIAFVHFLSIQTAMKVVAVLPTEPKWSGKRVNYGKDRCAYVPKGQQQIQAHNHQAAAMGLAAATWLGYPTGYMNYGSNNPGLFDGHGPQRRASADEYDGRAPNHPFNNVEPQFHQFGNRTVYLGNLHPDTTAEDICNHVRGGILQNIRYMPDRHIAFVTFIDANAALAFFHMASLSGVTIHNRRLKIGWGKPSGALSPAMALAVQSGASRNVYLGNIDDPELMNEDKIRADLAEYGELEMVNALRERNCVRHSTDPGLCQLPQHSIGHQVHRGPQVPQGLPVDEDQLRQGPLRQPAPVPRQAADSLAGRTAAARKQRGGHFADRAKCRRRGRARIAHRIVHRCHSSFLGCASSL